VRVKVYKEAALVTGLAKWGFKYKEQQVNQERRYTHMYVKQQGKWRIIAQQISLNLYANKISAPANPNQ
jgi:ketosteroid isomerase-like protein